MFATESAIGVLIVFMDPTHKRVKMEQVKLFMKVYKIFVISCVPVGKLNFCLSL